jgi:hypothetical protein
MSPGRLRAREVRPGRNLGRAGRSLERVPGRRKATKKKTVSAPI